MTERYVVVRSRPATPTADGWEVLSSVMFVNADLAREFAGKLDHARVYRLVPVAGPELVDTPFIGAELPT